MNNDIEQLKRDIQELKDWKSRKERQQISYPLDQQSIIILQRYFLRVVNTILQVGGAAGRTFRYFIIRQEDAPNSNLSYAQLALQQDTSHVFIVDSTTDIFTIPDGFVYSDGDTVTVFTDNTLPNPLVSGTTYYVVNSSVNTFKLSLTSGGAAINITTNGTGTQYIDYI